MLVVNSITKKIISVFFIFIFTALSSKNLLATTLFYDNFDDPALLKWEKSVGDTSWSVVSGRLYGEVYKQVESKIYMRGSQNFSDFVFTAEVENISGIDQHFLFRINEARNTYYQLELRYGEPSWPKDKNSLRIWKFVNGNYEFVRDIPYGLGQNQVYKLKVVFVGSRIQIYLDDSGPLFDWEDPQPILVGSLGLHNYAGEYGPRPVRNYFDNVKVSDGNEDIVTNNKIIILPGLGASWNEKAMVFNQTVGADEWTVTPFVKNYDNLVNILRQQGKEVLVWNYDWRRPVEEIKNNLNSFINTNIGSSEKVDLVGHSLGGLVARMWGQDNNSKKGKVITLGSPHDGAVSAYEAWNGGKVSDKFDAAGIALNILLQLNRRNFKTTVETIKSYAPVIGNLLPDFNFLKSKTGVVNTTEFNDYLKSKNQSIGFIDGWIKPVVGIGQSTSEWITLGERTVFEKILGIWPEGVPIKYDFGDGDRTVLKKSAGFEGQDYYQLASTHGDLVDKSVNYVLTTLGMDTVPEVVSGNSLENKMVFYIGSPAGMNLSCGTDTFESSDFLVVDVKDYKSCQLKLTGKDNGTYHLVYGLTNDENSWGYVENEIKNNAEQWWKFDVSQNGLVMKENGTDLKMLIGREIELLKSEYPNNKWLLRASDDLNKSRWLMLLTDIFTFRSVNRESKRTDLIVGYLKIIMTGEYSRVNRPLAKLAYEKMNWEKLTAEKVKNATEWKALNYLKFIQYANELDSAWRNNDYPRVVATSIVVDAYFAGLW